MSRDQREIERERWAPGCWVWEDGIVYKPHLLPPGDLLREGELDRYEVSQHVFRVIFNATRITKRPV